MLSVVLEEENLLIMVGGRCVLIFVWVPPFLFQHFSFCNINNQ